MPLSTPTSDTLLTLDSRLKSFAKSKSKAWPHPPSYKATPDTLARAGFAFTPDSTRKSDKVTCFVCGKNLAGWNAEDDPFTEHIAHSPSCSWALARCSIEALRVSLDSTEIRFHDEESMPTNPKLEAARLATFGKFWPHDSVRSHSSKSKHMAKAGFIYTPTNDSDDLASCFYCNLGLDGWESTDDPYHEHQRRRPHCAFFTARITQESEPELEPEPESDPKSRKGKTGARKAPASDPEPVEELAPSRSKKSTKPVVATVKRSTSKLSKPSKATPSDSDLIKPEPADDAPLDPPPKSKPKLRKSQSHGQLSTSLAKSTLGKSQLGRSQSQLGYSSTRSANMNTEVGEDDEDEDEAPVVAKKKGGAKTKSRAAEQDEEDEIVAPPATKPKGRAKKATSAVVEPEPEDENEEPTPPRPSKPKAAKASKTRSAKSKPKPPTLEPEPEGEADLEEGEPEDASVPAMSKSKTTTKPKAGGSTTKKDGRGKQVEQELPSEVEFQSAAEPEAESAVEDLEPEPVRAPPKKTRAKKATGTTKKTTRGKKGKARVDPESQAETESQAENESQAEVESEMDVDGPQTTKTPRPAAQDSTPRAAGTTTSGLPIPARSTPSPTRLPMPGAGGTRSRSGTPRIMAPGGSGMLDTPKATTNSLATPKAAGSQKPPSGTGLSKAGTPSATVTPRPVAQTSPTRPVFGVPLRSPTSRPVFGVNNANTNASGTTSANTISVNTNVDTIMASPARATTVPSPTRVGPPRSPVAKTARSPGIGPSESSVPFPRDSSPMTPTKVKAMPVPSALPNITAVLASTTAVAGPTVDTSLAELDAATRALTLEAYVRREMTAQYEALRADCEREIEDFLKAAKETRAKIAAL